MYKKCACCGHAINRRKIDLCAQCEREENNGALCGRDKCNDKCTVHPWVNVGGIMVKY